MKRSNSGSPSGYTRAYDVEMDYSPQVDHRPRYGKKGKHHGRGQRRADEDVRMTDSYREHRYHPYKRRESQIRYKNPIPTIESPDEFSDPDNRQLRCICCKSRNHTVIDCREKSARFIRVKYNLISKLDVKYRNLVLECRACGASGHTIQSCRHEDGPRYRTKVQISFDEDLEAEGFLQHLVGNYSEQLTPQSQQGPPAFSNFGLANTNSITNSQPTPPRCTGAYRLNGYLCSLAAPGPCTGNCLFNTSTQGRDFNPPQQQPWGQNAQASAGTVDIGSARQEYQDPGLIPSVQWPPERLPGLGCPICLESNGKHADPTCLRVLSQGGSSSLRKALRDESLFFDGTTPSCVSCNREAFMVDLNTSLGMNMWDVIMGGLEEDEDEDENWWNMGTGALAVYFPCNEQGCCHCGDQRNSIRTSPYRADPQEQPEFYALQQSMGFEVS